MTAKVTARGTHRTRSLDETRAWIWPHLRTMGITRVANITGLDTIGIPVAVACRPNARSLSVSQGKGLSLAAAEVSAAMEAIESYHAEHILRPLLMAAWRQVRGIHSAIDPTLLPKSVMGRFHDDLKIHWIEGFDLLHDEVCLVPYELVHTDFTLPLPSDSGCFPISSNGLASGNHVYEAITHGLCEVIERDAEALFACSSEAEQSGRVIDHATIDDPDCLALLERFAAAHVAVGIWDITSDVQVPAFRVVIMDREFNDARPLRPHVGMGCHPSRAVALARALTEAAQARLTVISSARDDLRRDRYTAARDFERLRQLRRQETAPPGQLSFQAVPDFVSTDVLQDVKWLEGQLIGAGIKHAIVVDLTKPEFDIPVVRVIVPGLETSREVPGWAPGPRARGLTGGWSNV